MDVLVVHGDVARIHRQVAVLGISGGVERLQLVLLDGLRDEPVQLGGPDAPGHGRDLSVDPPGRLRSQGRGGVDRGLGHHPGPPRRDPTRLHQGPQPGQAVPQLEGVPDQPLRRHRGHPQDGAELGDAELRHRRAALTGDGFLVLATRHGEGRHVVDRLGRVQVRPPGDEVELAGGSGVLGRAGRADRGEQTGGAEVVIDLDPGPRQRLDHVFECRETH
ncbi:hypothetical protein [Nocardioides astragali]|uniref:Uncharacterized protein n=1 Tax=Nocardioides astragali TaxID=1776736 RepID=A0ABW2N3Q4_9ACTN|nr:hypothetical protein [Nocardioides astragali]